ncbi:hypothetical protein [Streptomyces sp. NPDC007088]|uniref:hypothetical protein n=1 Tax=Streptomyces sp. NPDC007088 TaxID=3364773 RepID=UPI0036B2305D
MRDVVGQDEAAGRCAHPVPDSDSPAGSVEAGGHLAQVFRAPRSARHIRQRLESLKLDLRTDKQLAQDWAREVQRPEQRRKVAARRGVEDAGPVLDAIRAFGEQYGHTGIPVGARTEDGVEFGRHADWWRRQYARGTLDKNLRRGLERQPAWTWTRTPQADSISCPAPVPIPADTTQMRRPGLWQFLPSE